MIARNGVAALILAASSFVLGRLFGLSEFYVLGAGLLILVLVALATVAWRPIDLDVERQVNPIRPEVGEAAHVRVRITARRRSPLLELWEPVGDGTGAGLHLAPLRRGRRVEAAYLLPTDRRGVVPIGPLSAHISDPFGLVVRHRFIAPLAEVVVHPRTVALTAPSLSARGGRLPRRLAERALASTSADEFQGLRDYVPGDDLRRVHWGATARRGELLVRQTDPHGSLHVVVVFDLAATSYVDADRRADADNGSRDHHRHDDPAFELAVSAVASLALSGASHRPDMTIVTTDSERLAIEPSGIDATLERLALITPTDASFSHSVPRPVSRPSSSLAVAIVVTGPQGVEGARRLAAAAGPVDAVVVIGCHAGRSRPGTARRAALHLTPSDLDELTAEWTALVGIPARSS